jgi:hypothetical protein
LTDGHDAPVVVGGALLDVADLVGETEALAIDPALAGSTSDGCSAHTESQWWLPWTCSPSCSAICSRLNRRMRGKLATVIDQIEHGHHVFRAYFKHAFLKQYEKFRA